MFNKNKTIPCSPSYGGCFPDPRDDRDLSYDKIVAAGAPVEINWDKGFDIRNALGADINIKNQGTSLSCVGMGWSYYIWVKQVVEMMAKYKMDLKKLRFNHLKEVDEISAKAIYSQIFLQLGGAYIRSGAKLVVDWGALFEKLVPSIDPETNITSERWMTDKKWMKNIVEGLEKTLQGLKYAKIIASNDMDLFAQAISQNHGVVGGVEGQDGRDWNTENPLPPLPGKRTWGHCIYYGAFGTDDKGRFIATPNSWGNGFQNPKRLWKVGDPAGNGWQKLREDYFAGQYQFNPWTYVDKSNQPKEKTMPKAKIIKDADSFAVGVWLPAIGEEALRSYCLNFGLEIPRMENGDIDWDKLIQGELTLK